MVDAEPEKSKAMNHPETILATLDRHIPDTTRLILYGRAALALGFASTDQAFASTLDVDVILPLIDMAAIEANEGFWEALELTNAELEPEGLYITHLFAEDQVILTPDWLDRLVRIERPVCRNLRLFRPSAEDLILTKMMRIDPQDRADILFLLRQLPEAASIMPDVLEQAEIPPIQEIQEAFVANSSWLLTVC